MHDDDDDGLPKYVREVGEIEWHFVENKDQTSFSWTTILPTKISQNRKFLKPTTIVENFEKTRRTRFNILTFFNLFWVKNLEILGSKTQEQVHEKYLCTYKL